MMVDDAEENRFVLETMLEDDYTLGFASSGQECLAKLRDNQPDLILLDVAMPDMTGLEVCRKLKGNAQTMAVPIIFVSGLVSAEERLAGFEAGGGEYVTKPVNEQDLSVKVKNSLDAWLTSHELQVAADDAMNIAMEAMVSNSELGVINQFMRGSAQTTSFEALGEALLVVTRHFGLNCCIQFRSDTGCVNIACDAEGLEATLLFKFQDGEKFVDFGARTIVNTKQVGLLVKNMPLGDETKYGRVHDHLALVIDMVASKVDALNLMINAANERFNVIKQLIKNNDLQSNDIRKKISERDEYTLAVMRVVISDVEAQLFSLGLEEDQEELLIKMLDNAIRRIEDLPDFSGEIESSFAAVKTSFTKLID